MLLKRMMQIAVFPLIFSANTFAADNALKIAEDKISNEKLIVFGNLPYNISTEILSKWIVNLNKNFWFNNLVLMFQKEVADRIISEFNNSNYGNSNIIRKET